MNTLSHTESRALAFTQTFGWLLGKALAVCDRFYHTRIACQSTPKSSDSILVYHQKKRFLVATVIYILLSYFMKYSIDTLNPMESKNQWMDDYY